VCPVAAALLLEAPQPLFELQLLFALQPLFALSAAAGAASFDPEPLHPLLPEQPLFAAGAVGSPPAAWSPAQARGALNPAIIPAVAKAINVFEFFFILIPRNC